MQNDDLALVGTNKGLALPMIISGWLSMGDSARAICDARCRAVWANPQFFTAAQRHEFFAIKREIFAFTKKKDQDNLELFVEKGTNDTFMWLKDENDSNKFAVHIHRIKVSNLPDHFGIKISDAIEFNMSRYRHFETQYELTKREIVVCMYLLQGKTVHHIVNDHKNSSDTIRFHIRNIYRKMGVSSREEFFAHLRHYLFD